MSKPDSLVEPVQKLAEGDVVESKEQLEERDRSERVTKNIMPIISAIFSNVAGLPISSFIHEIAQNAFQDAREKSEDASTNKEDPTLP